MLYTIHLVMKSRLISPIAPVYTRYACDKCALGSRLDGRFQIIFPRTRHDERARSVTRWLAVQLDVAGWSQRTRSDVGTVQTEVISTAFLYIRANLTVIKLAHTHSDYPNSRTHDTVNETIRSCTGHLLTWSILSRCLFDYTSLYNVQCTLSSLDQMYRQLYLFGVELLTKHIIIA